MNLIEHDLIQLHTRNGENGVMVYNGLQNQMESNFNREDRPYCSPHDLYVISKDPIQNNDYYYDMFTQSVKFAHEDTDKSKFGRWRIIATTNPLLTGVPRIKKEVVDAYIRGYNSSNILTKVMLEYDHIGNQSYEIEEGKTDDYPIYDLKVNEDGTVNIYFGGSEKQEEVEWYTI